MSHHIISHILLRPAQVRYSSEMMESKTVTLEGDLYRGGVLLKVIKVQGDKPFYSLIDNHHHVLKALQMGAKHFEVWVEEVWTLDQYQKTLEENQRSFSPNLYFYLRNLKGEWGTPFLSMDHLLEHGEQDTLRHFLGANKTREFYQDGVLKDQSISGAPLWRKVMGDPPKGTPLTPPFAEFILADVLIDQCFDGSIKHAKEILIRAKKNPAFIEQFKGWEGFSLSWLNLT